MTLSEWCWARYFRAVSADRPAAIRLGALRTAIAADAAEEAR